MKTLPLLDAALSVTAALVPGAIGATVSVLFDQGLSWGQRFAQLAVGIAVSYFGGLIVLGIWKITDPALLDGIKFTLGLVAFKATPAFIGAAVEVARALPAQIRDRFLPKGD